MLNWDKIKAYVIKQIPDQQKLKDTVLYRIIGERLFKRELWKPTREGVARGMAAGMFITLTPTSGVQMLLSGLLSYLISGNIPIAVACAWISNPITAPIICPLQFKVGLLAGGGVSFEELAEYPKVIRILIHYGKPFLLGSIITAGIAAVLSYVLTIASWSFIEKVIKKRDSAASNDIGM